MFHLIQLFLGMLLCFLLNSWIVNGSVQNLVLTVWTYHDSITTYALNHAKRSLRLSLWRCLRRNEHLPARLSLSVNWPLPDRKHLIPALISNHRKEEGCRTWIADCCLVSSNDVGSVFWGQPFHAEYLVAFDMGFK
jgi:hypothetical protein